MNSADRVRYSAYAHAGIVGIADSIAEDSEAAGVRFIDAVFETAAQMADFPESGNVLTFGDETVRGCRYVQVIGFRNWLIVYRVRPDGVEIARVLHGARDPDTFGGG